jgi:hypothetical protein
MFRIFPNVMKKYTLNDVHMQPVDIRHIRIMPKTLRRTQSGEKGIMDSLTSIGEGALRILRGGLHYGP